MKWKISSLYVMVAILVAGCTGQSASSPHQSQTKTVYHHSKAEHVGITEPLQFGLIELSSDAPVELTLNNFVYHENERSTLPQFLAEIAQHPNYVPYIVKARVEHVDYYKTYTGMVMTYSRVAVQESLQGPLQAGDKITIQELGGLTFNDRLEVTEVMWDGQPTLKEGQERVLLLERLDKEDFEDYVTAPFYRFISNDGYSKYRVDGTNVEVDFDPKYADPTLTYPIWKMSYEQFKQDVKTGFGAK